MGVLGEGLGHCGVCFWFSGASSFHRLMNFNRMIISLLSPPNLSLFPPCSLDVLPNSASCRAADLSNSLFWMYQSWPTLSIPYLGQETVSVGSFTDNPPLLGSHYSPLSFAIFLWVTTQRWEYSRPVCYFQVLVTQLYVSWILQCSPFIDYPVGCVKQSHLRSSALCYVYQKIFSQCILNRWKSMDLRNDLD